MEAASNVGKTASGKALSTQFNGEGKTFVILNFKIMQK